MQEPRTAARYARLSRLIVKIEGRIKQEVYSQSISTQGRQR